jgi:hypothetical protein
MTLRLSASRFVAQDGASDRLHLLDGGIRPQLAYDPSRVRSAADEGDVHAEALVVLPCLGDRLDDPAERPPVEHDDLDR